MNKYLYLIKKLKIKPWIKYWLIKQTEFKGVLSDILEGTSFYLTDCLNMKFKIFDIIGRTTQESTTGANLQKFNARETATYNYKCDEKGQVTITGNISSYVSLGYNLSSNPMTLTAGTYKLKVIGKISSNTSILLNGTTGITLDSNQEYTYVLSNDTSSFYIALSVNTGTHDDNFYITLASGTTATTERYTGGEPAPNPKYPFPIKNTGDSGSVNEKIENKNLWNFNNLSKTQAGVSYEGLLGGIISANGTKNGQSYINFNTNKIKLAPGTYSSRNFCLSGSINKQVSVYLYNLATPSNQQGLSDIDGNGQTFTLLEGGEFCLRLGVWTDGTVFNNAKIGLMLVKGSTIPDKFVPHAEQTLSFPLAQGQKFYEGSHPDDDEKVHHKRMQIVLDGSDDEVFDKHSDTNEIRYYLPRNMKLNGKIIANYFMQMKSSSDKNYVRAKGTEPVNSLMFKSEILNTDEMTIPEWRQYLSEHNLILEIDLAEEQKEDFTSEQKTAWEQIKKARTYKNVTHISSEDETPAELKIQYYKEV